MNQKMTDENLSTFKDFFAYSIGSRFVDDSHPSDAKKFAFLHKFLEAPVRAPNSTGAMHKNRRRVILPWNWIHF